MYRAHTQARMPHGSRRLLLGLLGSEPEPSPLLTSYLVWLSSSIGQLNKYKVVKSRKKRLIQCGHIGKRRKEVLCPSKSIFRTFMRFRFKWRATAKQSWSWCGPAHHRPTVGSAPVSPARWSDKSLQSGTRTPAFSFSQHEEIPVWGSATSVF